MKQEFTLKLSTILKHIPDLDYILYEQTDPEKVYVAGRYNGFSLELYEDPEVISFYSKSGTSIGCYYEDSSVYFENFANEFLRIYLNPKRVINKDQRYKILKRQNWKCNFCFITLKFTKDSNWEGDVAHIDHIHPFSERETYHNGMNCINEDSNLQGLCPSCNQSKGKKKIN